MAEKKKSLSRRSKILLMLLATIVIVGTMIAFEQIALLYVIATLLLVGLLVVVGFSDLERVGSKSEGL